MSQSTNHNINICELSYEQRKQLFLALLEDISLINVLSSEKRHKLYTELITIEPSLAGSFLDARTAVHSTTNEQEYREYKQIQKQNKKEFQWHEFLKLDKLTCGEPISHQQKGIVEKIIKDFKEANPTFSVSEANFIFREWLALYCNNTSICSITKLFPKKKNIKPPNNKKRNMSDSITGTIILPTSIFKANVPGTEDLSSSTPGEVNTSETEANDLHVTPIMDKIVKTSIVEERKIEIKNTPLNQPLHHDMVTTANTPHDINMVKRSGTNLLRSVTDKEIRSIVYLWLICFASLYIIKQRVRCELDAVLEKDLTKPVIYEDLEELQYCKATKYFVICPVSFMMNRLNTESDSVGGYDWPKSTIQGLLD
ncbi:hypothetical protein RhiirA4_478684 [Rhizophagus irregularis]|uniref:Uncharacterized protein n=1 Tax=Rhizophagus irregularis TaxID=588596 RepID=A0A2I1HF90_9GLOM|nr:hypothetical protein RhiirA4_478684 [Rhizophagus irregularis]